MTEKWDSAPDTAHEKQPQSPAGQQFFRVANIAVLACLILLILVGVHSVRMVANLYKSNASVTLAAVASRLPTEDLAMAQTRLNELVSSQVYLRIELRTVDTNRRLLVAQKKETADVPDWAVLLLPEWQAILEHQLPDNKTYNGHRLTLTAWMDIGPLTKEISGSVGPLIALIVIWVISFSILISYHVSQYVSLPIHRMAQALNLVRPDHPGQTRIPVDPHHEKDEIGMVINAINLLLGKLDQSLQHERRSLTEIADREQFLNLVLNNVAEGIILLNAEHKVLRINQSACLLLGRMESEINGCEFESFFDIVDQTTLRTRLSRLTSGYSSDQVLNFELKVIKPAQEIVTVNLSISSVRNGNHTTIIALMRDAGETRRVQERIRLNEERLKLAVKATRSGVWDFDLRSDAFWWSPEFLPMLGYSEGEIKATLEAKYSLINPEDIEWVKTSHARYLAREIEDYTPEYRMKRKDGSWMWIEDRGTAEWAEDGTPLRFSGTMSDCTERKRFEKQLMYMATHDPLTELPNRTLLQDRLEHAITGNNRKGLLVGLLLLDIDRFKLINDSLGHEIGDHLVRAVAQRLQQNIRPTDTLARLSGDEFVVICEDLPTPQESARVAKRLLSAMTQQFNVDGNLLSIAVSIGISLSPSDGAAAQDLLRHADTAMHNAKASGGNCYRFFTSEMNKEAVQRLSLERHLAEAIDRQQFILHYQPKVDIVTKQVIGAEALIRWPHLTLGNLSPLQFIPIAEETGQIMAIGEWVIRETLSQICIWKERGLKPVPVAVNLSGKQLMSSGIDEMILRLLREYEVDPSLLEVEITESAIMSRMDKVLPPLQRLRDAGVGIALDDFGTGYSSLAYLRQLPITALKIDRSFVKDVPNKPEASPLVAIIVEIGRHLGLKVIAEGVETEAQREFLQKQMKEIICQGWLFYKALPVAKFEKLLESELEAP